MKYSIFSYPFSLTYVLGAQKNRLIEAGLLSIHNMLWLRNDLMALINVIITIVSWLGSFF